VAALRAHTLAELQNASAGTADDTSSIYETPPTSGDAGDDAGRIRF
jgi:hypothetical protein